MVICRYSVAQSQCLFCLKTTQTKTLQLSEPQNFTFILVDDFMNFNNEEKLYYTEMRGVATVTETEPIVCLRLLPSELLLSLWRVKYHPGVQRGAVLAESSEV